MNSAALHKIFRAALNAADPAVAVHRFVRRDGEDFWIAGEKYILADFPRIIVIGAGKATARMAQAVEEILGDEITDGLIVVKYGHTAPLKIIRQAQAGHPMPNEDGVRATKEMLDLLASCDANTLVINLLSGGGSALLVAPVQGVTLRDKQVLTDLLLRCGASIDELNAVRKKLSAVKGGRLALRAYPATVVSLIMSDVLGDRIDVIASGPTVIDTRSVADAKAVIEKYDLTTKIPDAAIYRLASTDGLQNVENQRISSNVKNIIVANLSCALEAAEASANSLGYTVCRLTDCLAGEARDAAAWLASRTREVLSTLNAGARVCLLSGGETTVTVHGDGVGGRNQEFALAFAIAIDGVEGVSMLSFATDGTDGPTDAAGAMVDGATLARARTHGLDAQATLRKNDSYTFFRALDSLSGSHSHVITGPTGTNVMDLQVVLIET